MLFANNHVLQWILWPLLRQQQAANINANAEENMRHISNFALYSDLWYSYGDKDSLGLVFNLKYLSFPMLHLSTNDVNHSSLHGWCDKKCPKDIALQVKSLIAD